MRKWAAVVLGVMLSFGFVNYISAGDTTNSVIHPVLPKNASESVRSLVREGWPKVLQHCPGLQRYASTLRLQEVWDMLGGTLNPEMNRVEVRYKVQDRTRIIPSRFNVNNHVCGFGISEDGNSIRIQKDVCASLCLDRTYRSSADYVANF